MIFPKGFAVIESPAIAKINETVIMKRRKYEQDASALIDALTEKVCEEISSSQNLNIFDEECFIVRINSLDYSDGAFVFSIDILMYNMKLAMRFSEIYDSSHNIKEDILLKFPYNLKLSSLQYDIFFRMLSLNHIDTCYLEEENSCYLYFTFTV